LRSTEFMRIDAPARSAIRVEKGLEKARNARAANCKCRMETKFKVINNNIIHILRA